MPTFWIDRNSGFTTRARTLDHDVHLADTVLHGAAGGLFGGELAAKGVTCETLNPTLPADAQLMTFPSWSVMDTMVC